MVDLSTLDELSPRDSDPVSQGDDAIRQTREAIKTTMALEHDLASGVHKIPSGASSVRPVAGKAGRLFMNTQTGVLEYDTGTEWRGTSGASSYGVDVWQKPISTTPVSVFTLNFGVPVSVLMFGYLRFGTIPPTTATSTTDYVLEVDVASVITMYFVGQLGNTVPVIFNKNGATALELRIYASQAVTGVIAFLEGTVLVI